jgi:hypothetical protein
VIAFVALLSCNTSGRSPPDGSITVGSSEVRSCELTLLSNRALRATFPDSVKGNAFSRGERVALTITVAEDEPFSGTPVRLEAAPPHRENGPALSIQLASTTCYDRLGLEVDKPGVNLKTD